MRIVLTRVFLSLTIAVVVMACGESAAPLPVACAATAANDPTATPLVAATDTAIPPFETVYHDLVALPANVQPWAPTWSPDGLHILFNNIVDGNEWVLNSDGSGARCLTCMFTDLSKITGAFSYIFPDNQRMLLANELGDIAFVLECAPTLFACSSHTVSPIDFSADSPDPTKLGLGRRTFHLAPDGVHLAYSMVRQDALIMMIAELQKTTTGYAAVNHRVVNPPGPTGPADMNVEGYANAGQLYEFKTFVDGGASALVVGQPVDGNADTLKLDLATGQLTRLTADVDWDEDGAISPNGENFLVASWRTMHRLEAFGQMPLGKPFFDYPLGAAVAIYYVSSFQGFQCDLQPWLLPADGDRNASLRGQPLAPYQGGDIIAGNNLAALSFWSPDSTRVLVQERMTTTPAADAGDSIKQKGYSPNRLLIARIDRAASPIPAAVTTQVGAWALTPETYQGILFLPSTAVIQGKNAGQISVTYGGNVAAGAFAAVYNGYSEDGENFLDGTAIATGGPTTLLNYAVNLTASDAAGNTIGSETGNVQFMSKQPAPAVGEPPSTKSGTITATYRGQTAKPLPDVGPCLDSLPKPSRLILTAERSGATVVATVTANVYGDLRPVRHAVVTLDGQQLKTDALGKAIFSPPPSASTTLITAAAGDTFLPAQTTITSDSAPLPGCAAKAVAPSATGNSAGAFTLADLLMLVSLLMISVGLRQHGGGFLIRRA